MYMYIFILVTLLVLIGVNKYVRNTNLFLVSIDVLFSLSMGLRGTSVGTDTSMYGAIYSSMAQNPLNSPLFWKFPVYNVYNYIIAQIFNSYQIELFINALIINSIVLYVIKKYSKNIELSIYLYYTLYFYFTAFNITRQYMAISFCLIFLHFLIEKKLIKASIFILLAVGIHTTSIIGLIFIPIVYIPWTKKRFLVAISSISVMFIFTGKFISLFMSTFSNYSIYSNGATTTLSTQNDGNRIFLSLFYLGMIIISIVYSPNKLTENNISEESSTYLQRYYIFQLLASIGTMIGLVFNRDILILRIELFFSIFLIILITYTMKEILEKSGPIQEFIIKSVMCLLAVVPFFVQLGKNIGRMLPYMFFWQ